MNDRSRLRGLGALVLLLSVFAIGRDDHARTPAPPVATAAGATPDPEETGAARGLLDEGGRVDINRASASELRLLPRVGPALAERIVEARRLRGGFSAVEQLAEVRGVGPRTLEALRPVITLGTPGGGVPPESAR